MQQLAGKHGPAGRMWSILILSIAPLLFAFCGKSSIAPGTASLTIVNAMPGSRGLLVNFKGSNPFVYANVSPIMYSIDGANSTPVNSYSGNQPMTIYQFPDTLDKDVPLFRLTLPLPIASISTLFLTGTASSPDTLFTTDVLPYHTAADSTMGIRFMNLSPGSRPVNIRVKGQSGAPIGSNLAYKGTTRFMIMPAGTQQGDYTFEFRDAVTETLLISYTTKGIQLPPQNFRNAWTYRNSTLALMGLPGGTGETALGVSHISY